MAGTRNRSEPLSRATPTAASIIAARLHATAHRDSAVASRSPPRHGGVPMNLIDIFAGLFLLITIAVYGATMVLLALRGEQLDRMFPRVGLR